MDTLAQIEKLVDGLAPTDDPDELGHLTKIINKLYDLKRTSLAELAGPVSGSEYRVTESRSAKRSYNTAAVLRAFDDQNWTLQDLVREDAVRVSFQWTNLKRVANLADVTLRISQHEVEDEGDVDGEMIGEVWTSSYKIEGVKG